MTRLDLLTALTIALLPRHRRAWGQAMQNEARIIANASEAIDFALGCLGAAAWERIKIMITFTNIGHWSVGAVTAAYGGFFLYSFSHVAAIALGGADRYYDGLVAHHHAAEAEAYHTFFPYMALFVLGMGVFNLAAAIGLVGRRPRLFVLACTAIGGLATALTAYGLTTTRPILAWAWPFGPLALLIVATIVLWRKKVPPVPIAA